VGVYKQDREGTLIDRWSETPKQVGVACRRQQCWDRLLEARKSSRARWTADTGEAGLHAGGTRGFLAIGDVAAGENVAEVLGRSDLGCPMEGTDGCQEPPILGVVRDSGAAPRVESDPHSDPRLCAPEARQVFEALAEGEF